MRRSHVALSFLSVALLAGSAAAQAGTDSTHTDSTAAHTDSTAAAASSATDSTAAAPQGKDKKDKKKKESKAEKDARSKNPVLEQDEILDSKYPTAYEVVERLRRPWLRVDPAIGSQLVVYVDNQNKGGVDVLKDILSIDVAKIEFLNSDQAMSRWGDEAKAGAIMVTRKR